MSSIKNRLLSHPAIAAFFFLLLVMTGSNKSELPVIEHTFSCAECDYIVKGYHNDGRKIPISPGQIICFDASMKYNTVKLNYIKGTKLKPVIIRNCGGVATISE